MPKSAQYLPDKQGLKSDKAVKVEVCQCSGCALVQLNNDPVSYYREVIRAVAFSKDIKEFRKKQFLKFIKKFNLKEKKIIEIGCGEGEYLFLLRQSKVKAYGIEYSAKSVAQCAKKSLSVSKAFIANSKQRLKHAPFDAFFMFSFLEHLPDPNSALRGIHHNLTDKAVGIVEVPNFDMILRNKLFSEFILDHLFYFTRETLCRILEFNGFEVLECSEIWHDYILSAVVRKREKLDIRYFYKHQERLKSEIKNYISNFRRKKIAIWGAGHQALALICLVNIADKIKYVVDSAIFKQNKYTAASHIPIVSPDVLTTDPVDALVIMAGSYSDEVYRTIRKVYKSKIKVAILRDYGLELCNIE
jgi:SAM-dependent methyltransferase